ncbi:hypothetical protein [Halomonas hibernica]|uniref:hypothetical protein n=1 Tax=Halomonas hibernica TaxID=2591147 RepID=UPI001553AEA8|nr:hypothetical protein [Halomonas hibernica]
MESETEPQHDAGCAAYDPRSEGAVKMWIAAVKLYAQDVLTAALGRQNADNGRALRDLRSEQRQLRILCEPLGADVEAVARAIEKCVARGYGAGIPVKPQRRKVKQKRAA